MNIGIVISQVEPETVWNAFRFANFSIDKGHKVNTFLMGKGVECVDIKSEEYPALDEINKYIKNKGEMFACGTCLVSRGREGTPICPMSTMEDLMNIVEKSDKLLTF